MAGAGFKVFATGDVLSASDVNTYMMQQTVMVFANASARTSALSAVLAEGMVSYLQDTNALEVYDGSAWVGATGDITGLTAGTGISITSATGPVPTVAIDTAVVPRLGVANTFTEQNIINASGTSTVDLIVKATSGQSVALQQWQDPSSTVMSQIIANGALRIGTNIAATGVGVNLDYVGAATVGLVVRGAASQTANLFEAQDSSGNILTKINSSGNMEITGSSGIGVLVVGTNGNSVFSTAGIVGIGTTASGTYQVNIINGTAARIGLRVRGAASQTANLQEWQNSAGTVQAYVNASGDVKGRLLYAFTTANLSASVNVGTASTGSKGIVVAGQSGQTANLTEWQSSTGTVLAKVDFGGFFTAAAFSTGNSLATLFEENSGGRLRLTKATAANTNPGADIAKIYLRDGTNAGTLKLVVRAGASGAETTILDNIPQ